MIDWKNQTNGNIATLLKRAADCQIELGTKEMVINLENLSRKKSELAKRGNQITKSVQGIY